MLSYVNEKVCVFTTICQEDYCWVGNYLEEIERLGVQFYMHFDRCTEELKRSLANHFLCRGITEQDVYNREYTEQDKQGVFDLVQNAKQFDWAFSWDIDETYERKAPEKLLALQGRLHEDYINTTPWVNLHETKEFIRTDGPFAAGHRVKFYNVSNGRKWKFDHPITYGCKLMDAWGNCPHGHGVQGHLELATLHWGLMTHELRELHRKRWDRVYGAAVGANPYELWNYAVNFPAVTIPNPYL